MKRYCVLGVAGVLLAVAVVCVAQQPTPDLAPRPPAVVPEPLLPPVAPTTRPAQPQEKSVDELLARLDALQVQQAELDKAKTETVALLKEKLKQQKQRLQKLGVNAEEEDKAQTTSVTNTADPLTRGALTSPAHEPSGERLPPQGQEKR